MHGPTLVLYPKSFTVSSDAGNERLLWPATMRQLTVVTWGILLAISIATANAQRRRLINQVRPSNQTSLALDSSLKRLPDISLPNPPLARAVGGFQPEGIHVTPWQYTPQGWTMLVSWQTGDAKLGSSGAPPQPYDPSKVPGMVKYGRQQGMLDSTATGKTDIVYSYKYDGRCGGNTYQSPIIHHVLVKGLSPGATYSYVVGNPGDGFSKELNLKVPPAVGQLPLRLAMVGDMGETPYSARVVDNMVASDPDIVLMLGDLTYADNYCSDGTSCVASCSDQRRWDSWARLTQPLVSKSPMLATNGNHELEMQLANNKLTFAAYNARYPGPPLLKSSPDAINVSPNYGSLFLGPGGRFKNEQWVQTNSSYYSVDVSGAHIVSMSNYVPWGKDSKQYSWLVADLASVNHGQMPWLLVMVHSAPRHSFVDHYKEMEEFMSLYEPIFYKSRVDMVLSGHVHAAEITAAQYNYSADPCGVVYMTVGTGGTAEGHSRSFIDAKPPSYCKDPSQFDVPDYQPSPSGRALPTFQDGLLCPASQPKWSLFRDPTMGHGLLTLHNSTHADWQWYHTTDSRGKPTKQVWVIKDPVCSVG